MRKPIKLIPYAAVLLMAAGCDTQEDVFMVGDEPDKNNILTVDAQQVTFTPEGGSFEINVTSIASWRVTVSGSNTGDIKVSPTSGRGNGVITVTAGLSQANAEFRATLEITPDNFDMDEPVYVYVSQNYTTFDITTSPSSDPVAESGGTVEMRAATSVDWELVPVAHDAAGNIGDINWLTVTPGLEGEGKSDASSTNFSFEWSPNYTESPRTICLQFKPKNENFSSKQKEFTLQQVAGTRPQNVRCNLDNLDIVNAQLTLGYNSIAPMKDCGVMVYKLEGGNATLVETYRPDGDSYQTVGSYTLSLPELTENTSYRLVPFAENEVGRVEGDPQEITTGIKPENMVYEGVAIVNPETGGVTIETDLTSATITLVATSDVEPLSKRIASAVMTFDGRSVNGTATTIDEGSWTYVFRTASAGVELTSNKEYDYTITITGGELPRSQGQVTNNVATVSGKFKTQGRTPDSGDNNTPVVGE